MSWRHLRGPRMQSTVKIGTSALEAGDPVKDNSGVVDAATDGARLLGVLHEDGAANETKIKMDHLVPGSVWEATLAAGASPARGARVQIADADTIDGDTDAWSPGFVVDADGVAGATVHIYIEPRHLDIT